MPTTLADFERRFVGFQREYNEDRPHAALGMHTPRSRFLPSPRAYQARPREWEYPSDWLLRRVTSNGVISIGGHQYFVSEALIGETVACRPFAHRWLVTYRHMYVRELHVRSHRSVPLLQMVDGEWPAVLPATAGLDEV